MILSFVFHHTDTQIYILSLALALLIHNKQNGFLPSVHLKLLSLTLALTIHNKQLLASGVQSAQSNLGSSYFHSRRAAFSCLLKSKCDNIITKVSALRVNLNLDGAPIASNSHTHPSHSQTSHLLTSSLSLGVPVPRPTQCL